MPKGAEIRPVSILTAGSRSPEEFALYIGLAGIEFEVLEGDAVGDAVTALAERLGRAASSLSRTHSDRRK